MQPGTLWYVGGVVIAAVGTAVGALMCWKGHLVNTAAQKASENRPYVAINSHPVRKADEYCVVRYNRARNMQIWIEYELHNSGNAAATDLVYYAEAKITDRFFGAGTKTLNAPPKSQKMALGPDQRYYVKLGFQLGETEPPPPNAPPIEILAKEVDSMIQESGLLVKFTLEYKSEYDETTIFGTTKTHKVFKNRHEVIESTKPVPVENS